MFKAIVIAAVTACVSAAEFFKAIEKIENSYVVMFKKGTSMKQIVDHHEMVASKKVQVDHKYTIGDNFNGYAAHMDEAQLNLLLSLDEVDFVEEDGVYRVNACKAQEGATWGLVRTSEVSLKITGEYKYAADGAGVTAYIIDTGIYVGHDEFEGRASWGGNFVDSDDTDGNGHGTHCAGTVGGKTYGMAKGVALVGIKVLSASGSGSTAGVIKGIEYVANNAKKPAVSNLSLGGGLSSAMNAAVDATVNEGVTMVVAAGNDNRDACSYSPASAETAISVAASDNRDVRATFSNYGKCTDIFAPGVSITSAWINSRTSTNTISGTSMACPHVVGQVAKFLGDFPSASPALAATFISSIATDGLVTNIGTGSTNSLLFADCDSFGVTKKLNHTVLASRYA